MKYLSVCSGIEAATVAWHHMGWQPVAFSEIEPFPSAVLAHHYPSVPNWGDMTKFKEWPDANIDLLVGGTPCQSFSVAGLRQGLDDPRGNLMRTYLEIAQRYRPEWMVWENVPGVLSSNGGRDFGALLGGLAKLGYGWSYRVLDAQYFGVPQRRRRVFVVANARGWQRAAAVLFERNCVGGNRAPLNGEEEAAGVAITHPANDNRAGVWWDGGSVSQTLDAVLYKKQAMPEKNRFPAVLVPAWQQCECCDDFVCNTHHGQHVFECDCPHINAWADVDLFPYNPCVLRYITCIEAERFQGFPDDYTNISWRRKSESPDGPRYKAIGNSMAVPVMRWIGERINEVSKI